MRYRSCRIIAASFIALALLCALSTGAWAGRVVEVNPGSADCADCSAQLEYGFDGINAGVLRLKTSCPMTPEKLAANLRVLLPQIPAQGRSQVTSLFVGRVETLSGEYSYRMARAALLSKGWDKREGRPVNGYTSQYVEQLLAGSNIFEELEAVFAEFGMTIRPSSVEKVIVVQASKLSFYGKLWGTGVLEDDLLPHDALLWFSINRPAK